MYIHEILIRNYGCIDNLNIIPEFNENGSPKPIVLVGKNGSGKTLLLSSIIDALVQLKRKKYVQIQEVEGDKLYKLGDKSYIKTGSEYSYVKIKFNGVEDYIYVDCMVHNFERFKAAFPTDLTNLQFNDKRFQTTGYFKTITGEPTKEFDKNLIQYFPVHRYYQPSWLNENINITFEKQHSYIGHSKSNIIKSNILLDIENWILNVMLDRFLYEQENCEEKLYYKSAEGFLLYEKTLRKNTDGKNTIAQKLINELLKTIYINKNNEITGARIGLSNKEQGRSISILLTMKAGNEVIVAPTFHHLSSGEALLLSLFCSLLKDADLLNSVQSLEEVKGVVVIDEIDLNLHIDYAKNVLPKLIATFPKVQFIITSHSPFFLIGMKEQFGNNYQLINLPHGEQIEENDFTEMRDAYNVFTQGFEEVYNNMKKLRLQLNVAGMPLVITEGKTDWKHLKKALESYKALGHFSDLDVEIHEYEDELQMGDSQLNSMLIALSKISHSRKIIGIFDCDEGNGKKYSKNENKFESLGNNVYALSIQIPNFREYHEGISVEFLYTNEDLFRTDDNHRRLYLTSEFNDKGRLQNDASISHTNLDKIKKYLDQSKSKIVDHSVTDGVVDNLALSKADFAKKVLDSTTPFDSMNFDGFKKLLETIEEINKLHLL